MHPRCYNRRQLAPFQKAVLRGVSASALYGALLISTSCSWTENSPARLHSQNLMTLAAPGELVPVGLGRRVHLRCAGSGLPSVILSAGRGDWSLTWQKIQPEVARFTRVCSWDRPGSGFSDPSSEEQDVLQTTSDLINTLEAARVPAPYLLVGHSYGSFESLLLAFQRTDSASGLVLIDPSVPEQYERFEAVAPKAGAFLRWSEQEKVESLRACIAAAIGDKLPATNPGLDDCIQEPNPAYPPILRQAITKAESSSSGAQNLLSLMLNWKRSSSQLAAAKRHLKNLPLIVLTSGNALPLPPELTSESKLVAAEWRMMHREIAELSTAGEQRLVLHAGHHIHLDQPQVVIEAIHQAVLRARSSQRQ